MKQTITDGLIELAKHREIIVLTGESMCAEGFAERFPEKIIQCGMAEQAMLGIAAGLSLEGKTPFIITNKQMNTLGYEKFNIKMIIIGNTALSEEATVIKPSDTLQLKKSIIAAGTTKGFIAIITEQGISQGEDAAFSIGRAEIKRNGKDCTIIASGKSVKDALIAAEKLSVQGIDATVLNCHTLNPIDKHAIINSAMLTGCIVLTERNNSIMELLSRHNPVPIKTAESASTAHITGAVREIVVKKITGQSAGDKQSFRLNNGKTANTLQELYNALTGISEEEFTHHCNNKKNDFANWIEAVFGKYFSKQTENAKTKEEMARIVGEWIG